MTGFGIAYRFSIFRSQVAPGKKVNFMPWVFIDRSYDFLFKCQRCINNRSACDLWFSSYGDSFVMKDRWTRDELLMEPSTKDSCVTQVCSCQFLRFVLIMVWLFKRKYELRPFLRDIFIIKKKLSPPFIKCVCFCQGSGKRRSNNC